MLFTQCGMLVHKLMAPENHIPKVYDVVLKHPLKGSEEVEKLKEGIKLKENYKSKNQLNDENEDENEQNSRIIQCKPAKFTVTGTHSGRIEIVEGKYHQIRRMFAALGNRVTQLHRRSIGGLTLSRDDSNSSKKDYYTLNEGQYRLLTDKEVLSLWRHK